MTKEEEAEVVSLLRSVEQHVLRVSAENARLRAALRKIYQTDRYDAYEPGPYANIALKALSSVEQVGEISDASSWETPYDP